MVNKGGITTIHLQIEFHENTWIKTVKLRINNQQCDFKLITSCNSRVTRSLNCEDLPYHQGQVLFLWGTAAQKKKKKMFPSPVCLWWGSLALATHPTFSLYRDHYVPKVLRGFELIAGRGFIMRGFRILTY